MNVLPQLHELQREILVKLNFSNGLRHAALRPQPNIENNQFNFHLKQLLQLGLIEKINELYKLSLQGKEYCNRIESETKKVLLQAKLSVWIAPVRIVDGVKQYLIYTRKKNPFYGAQGFLAGKLGYGEMLQDGATRELLEETGLSGKPELLQIRHYVNYSQETNDIIEDKFMFLFRVMNPTGNLQGNDEGDFEWIKESEFKNKVTNHFESFESFLEDIDLINNWDGSVKVVERKRFPANF